MVSIWSKFLNQFDVLVYMIDVSMPQVADSAAELFFLLENEYVATHPILVLLNKGE